MRKNVLILLNGPHYHSRTRYNTSLRESKKFKGFTRLSRYSMQHNRSTPTVPTIFGYSAVSIRPEIAGVIYINSYYGAGD